MQEKKSSIVQQVEQERSMGEGPFGIILTLLEKKKTDSQLIKRLRLNSAMKKNQRFKIIFSSQCQIKLQDDDDDDDDYKGSDRHFSTKRR